jgi:hypothetical protein
MMRGEIVKLLDPKQEVYLQFDFEWVPGKVRADVSHSVLSATGKPGPPFEMSFLC